MLSVDPAARRYSGNPRHCNARQTKTAGKSAADCSAPARQCYDRATAKPRRRSTVSRAQPAGSILPSRANCRPSTWVKPSRLRATRFQRAPGSGLNPDLTLRFCSFPENTNIQGYLCRGGSGGSEGVTTGFYPSGRLQSFFPPKDIEIQGIPCRATPFGPVSLYENGNLKQLTLARDTVIGGRSLDEGQTVVLSERGEVQSVSNPPMIERARSWFKKLFR